MQLVQPSKFFSVIIFRIRFYRQYWHARVRTWAMLLFLVTLKNFDVCTATMGVACPLLRRSITALFYIFASHTGTVKRPGNCLLASCCHSTSDVLHYYDSTKFVPNKKGT